jgi:hypothetical protein
LNVPTALLESADVDELLEPPPAKVELEDCTDRIALGIKGAANGLYVIVGPALAAFGGLVNLLLIAIKDASPLSCIKATSAETA